jgi:V/A-type H+-transporting ATPase subunit G/H
LERPSAGDRSDGGHGASSDRSRPARSEDTPLTQTLDEERALEGLEEEERRLDQRIERVRAEARAIVARAREEADRRARTAAAELAAEVERLRDQRRRELEQALASMREDTARQVETLRRRAESNREHAVVWLLSKVTGEDEP